MQKILVWDWPTRLGHWLLACAFIMAWGSGDSEEWRLYHVAAGYVMAAVLLFRIFWGVAGTRYARFSSFLFCPRQLLAYLQGIFNGRPAHWVGHNPAGSYAIYLLMLLGCGVTASGLAVYYEIGGEWPEELHAMLAETMLIVVGVHVAGVVISSLLHRENLVRSMIVGYKQGRPEQAIESGKGAWVLLLAGLSAVAGWLAFTT
jgi:cytochrome b